MHNSSILEIEKTNLSKYMIFYIMDGVMLHHIVHAVVYNICEVVC